MVDLGQKRWSYPPFLFYILSVTEELPRPLKDPFLFSHQDYCNNCFWIGYFKLLTPGSGSPLLQLKFLPVKFGISVEIDPVTKIDI